MYHYQNLFSISADYPYINYYVINKTREEAGQFYTQNKMASHDSLNASKLGYHVAHSMDLYDEVITGVTYHTANSVTGVTYHTANSVTRDSVARKYGIKR